ncbi:MAG: hypothetical protein JSV78_04215 [Phycisphaerales bacterium]|nr:MAG: hypothetical protein JSV78_04215 [Phycisphaerales bacterium]
MELDFTKLKTPSGHGSTLVLPRPVELPGAVEEGGRLLRDSKVPLLDSTIGEWRRRTRERIAGTDARPILVTGHQPAFVHAGVWAKHVVASRLAQALDGVAVNLVVDNDAPRSTSLEIPRIKGDRVDAVPVPFASLRSGQAFEQIPRQPAEVTSRFEGAVREAMGDRYERSQFPVFFESFGGIRRDARDWVDQAVAGRRAIEARFGVRLQDRRVSDHWCSPLLLDILLNAGRFREAYNQALADYRRANKVRGLQRPIPDLIHSEGSVEVPVWTYRENEVRRRLFVKRLGDTLHLFADNEERIGEVRAGEVSQCDHVQQVLGHLEGWRFRPRALTLTIWARLLLADLFIHGIGGAKYDRISNRIMADYYGVTPPPIACVSATLLVDLPHSDATAQSAAQLRARLRDVRFNPQRHLPVNGDLRGLVARRAAAVRQSIQLRRNRPSDHSARRGAFNEIRAASQAILNARREVIQQFYGELKEAQRRLHDHQAAMSREYFFGLHSDRALEDLCDALPAMGDFGV